MTEPWDILKRCRVFADGFDENYIARGIAEDAHDEIVALRARVAELEVIAISICAGNCLPPFPCAQDGCPKRASASAKGEENAHD